MKAYSRDRFLALKEYDSAHWVGVIGIILENARFQKLEKNWKKMEKIGKNWKKSRNDGYF